MWWRPKAKKKNCFRAYFPLICLKNNFFLQLYCGVIVLTIYINIYFWGTLLYKILLPNNWSNKGLEIFEYFEVNHGAEKF